MGDDEREPPKKPWEATRPGLASVRLDQSGDHTLAIFDVPDDKARRRLGEMCKDYGLARFQWSAFEGRLSRNRREELSDRARRLLAKAPGGGKFVVLAVGARELAGAFRIAEVGVPAPPATGTEGKGGSE